MILLVRAFILSILLMSGIGISAQELSEKEVEGISVSGQNISLPIVRINPESEMVESSERIVEKYVESNLGEKVSQERAEQINFVIGVFLELNTKSTKAREDLTLGIDAFITEGIEKISNEKPQSSSVLKRLIDPLRNEAYYEMMWYINNPQLLVDPTLLDQGVLLLEEKLELIQASLETEGEVVLDLDLKKNRVIESLREYQRALEVTRTSLSESTLLSVITDRDRDGLSDFAEEVIVLTDSAKRSTIGSSSTDQEVLLLGKNASDLNLGDTQYKNISQDSFGIHSSLGLLGSVEQQEGANRDSGAVLLKGLSVPSSVVHGYIYPENIVFITKVDSFGLWEHSLTQDLVNGEYQVYLAHLEANGNPVVRSESYTFIHENGAALLEESVPAPEKSEEPLFDNATSNEESIFDSITNNEEVSQILLLSKGPLAEFIGEFFLVISGALALLGFLVSFILIKSGSYQKPGAYYSAMSGDGPTVNQAHGRSLYENLDEPTVGDES